LGFVKFFLNRNGFVNGERYWPIFSRLRLELANGDVYPGGKSRLTSKW
jgi:hypothetical protein